MKKQKSPFEFLAKDYERTINLIKDSISLYYKKDRSVFKSKSRNSKIVKFRHLAIYFAHRALKVSSKQVGSSFDCSHSMVIYACKQFDGYLEWDDNLRQEVEDVGNIIKQSLADTLNTGDSYYYINLNEFHSCQLDENKALILKGFTEEELKNLKLNDIELKDYRKHINQNFYILDEKNNNTSQGV